MTWEQMLLAAQALGPRVALRMRHPGNWYVDQPGVAVRNGSLLEGRYGNGANPEEAVRDHWDRLTNIPSDQYLVIDDKRNVRWNGFMWMEWEATK